MKHLRNQTTNTICCSPQQSMRCCRTVAIAEKPNQVCDAASEDIEGNLPVLNMCLPSEFEAHSVYFQSTVSRVLLQRLHKMAIQGHACVRWVLFSALTSETTGLCCSPSRLQTILQYLQWVIRCCCWQLYAASRLSNQPFCRWMCE